MRTRFVEATQGVDDGFNWGKFMVALLDQEEWERPSALMAREAAKSDERIGIDRSDPKYAYKAVGLLRTRGWSREHVLVMDIETGEGAMFLPGGSPSADLDKHKIWVCPMFEPFLAWLYEHVAKGDSYVAEVIPGEYPYTMTSGGPSGSVMRRVSWFELLPTLVELPGVPGALAGYRRAGPDG